MFEFNRITRVAGGIATVTAAGLAFTALPAQAAATATATVVAPGSVRFDAAPGQVNNLSIFAQGLVVTFDDDVAITAGAGCAPVDGDATQVTCDLGGPATASALVVNLRDGADSVGNGTGFALSASGGAGNDQLFGGPGADLLDGGAGDDVLYGNDGDDLLLAGGGDDDLIGGLGADVHDGGAGRDEAFYSERSTGIVVDLDNARGDDGEPGEGDSLLRVEDVTGTIADDVLTGNNSDNSLIGSSGQDTIAGLGGDDYLEGGQSEFDGPDALNGGANRTTAGDTCRLSLAGGTTADCETVTEG
ncbi:hypothetical protein AB0M02_28405 [Actinoplanes sp. NPDC051861]|uniref:calcium-binding protein n=1 Tax=Actinoplanes sp. NPDC051861 TaxID=3155170 RepID=UPI00343044CD